MTASPTQVMSHAEWSKTPYAKSEARDPDKNIRDILTRYKVKDIQTTETTGPNGRPYFSIRFKLDEIVYRVGVECLNARGDPEQLKKQAKRAIFHLLKSMLEYASIFAPLEQMLFAFIETQSGRTVYDVAKPHLAMLAAPGDFRTLLALPSKENA